MPFRIHTGEIRRGAAWTPDIQVTRIGVRYQFLPYAISVMLLTAAFVIYYLFDRDLGTSALTDEPPGFAGGSNFQIGWSHDEQNDEQVFP